VTPKQNAHLTFKENVQAGRHGWIRLTPAYSYRLVEETLTPLDRSLRVLDPFSGSGTTGLVAATLGFHATLVDLNPFLVWLARAKTRNYRSADLDRAAAAHVEVAEHATRLVGTAGLWMPPMHQLERWWPGPTLASLAALRGAIDKLREEADWFDLLEIALCRTLIRTSNAAFNHQSMSFRTPLDGQLQIDLPSDPESASVIARFEKESQDVIASAREHLVGQVDVIESDSRDLAALRNACIHVLYSSPPYVNRMSYIRELRPYMYWLRFLDKASEAGELDWQAIGGTWGIATSRLNEWEPADELDLPSLASTLAEIRTSGAPNARLLARYVAKYFVDMASHFAAANRVVAPQGRVVYVIGNSVFYGKVVHAEKLYAELLSRVGFREVKIETIRKRNSKKELFEYSVSGVKT